MRTIARIVVNAFALWVTTLVVGGPGEHGIWVVPYDGTDEARIITLLLVALAFGLVNATLGRVVRFVSIPLTILTLGLFALVINGIMLSVVAWLSEQVGFGIALTSLGWGIVAALVLSILSGVLNGLLGTKKRKKD